MLEMLKQFLDIDNYIPQIALELATRISDW